MLLMHLLALPETDHHMTYILGLDTGGTFTDAAIIDSQNGALIAKAKAPTTRQDLSIGLGAAIHSVINPLSDEQRKALKQVCLSILMAL